MRPFSVTDRTISDALVEIKLREDNQLRSDFQSGRALSPSGQKEYYPRLAEKTLTMLDQAPSTYRYEAGFSVMLTIKAKPETGSWSMATCGVASPATSHVSVIFI